MNQRRSRGGSTGATWRLARGALDLEPFAPLSARDARALAADAQDVERFLAGT